jgi:hypothetical protein
VYRLQIMNAAEQQQRYRVRAAGLPGLASDLRDEITIDAAQARWVALAVRLPPDAAAAAGAGAHKIEFVIERVGEPGDAAPRTQIEKSTFMVPR